MCILYVACLMWAIYWSESWGRKWNLLDLITQVLRLIEAAKHCSCTVWNMRALGWLRNVERQHGACTPVLKCLSLKVTFVDSSHISLDLWLKLVTWPCKVTVRKIRKCEEANRYLLIKKMPLVYQPLKLVGIIYLFWSILT